MRDRLRDIALLLLAVVTVVGAAYVVTRSPAPDRVVVPTRPQVAAPTRTATPVERVQAIFLGSEVLQTGLAEATAAALDWDAAVSAVAGTGYVTGDQGQTYADRAEAALNGSEPDVVVVVSSSADAEQVDGRVLGGNAQRLLAAVRVQAPQAEVVLVGPLAAGPDGSTLQRDVLTQVAARFGAVFVDPAGRGYLGRSGLVGPDGSLTPDGVQAVATRLAADLRRVLPVTLVPSAAPTP